jgi:hypothetical protein
MWIAAVAASVAAAASRPARADEVAAPSERVIGASAEWMPYGQTVYSGNDGEIDFDDDQAFGAAGWLGWEPTPGFEIGAQVRYVAHEHISGDTASGSELIVAPRIAAHTRPSPKIDLAFVVLPGYSHVFLPATVTLPDASGFTVDFAGEMTVPLDGSVYGVVSLGYQRGFQRTTEPSPFPGQGGMPLVSAWATGYIHMGFGLAKRF